MRSRIRPPRPLGLAGPARPGELGVQFRRALREAARFDRSAFAPLVGARVALGVVIALIIGRAFGGSDAEASMAAGALLAGIPGATNSGRISLRAIATVAAVMALSTFVGSTTGELGWVHTAVLVPWCLAGGVLMGLGSPASAIGTQGIAAMIVFGRFAEEPLAALHLAGYVLAGGLIAVAVLGFTRSPVTSRTPTNGPAFDPSSTWPAEPGWRCWPWKAWGVASSDLDRRRTPCVGPARPCPLPARRSAAPRTRCPLGSWTRWPATWPPSPARSGPVPRWSSSPPLAAGDDT